MDSNRFDSLSRSFANRTSRRGALRWLGLGGLGAGALAATGLNDATVAADNVRCVLAIKASVVVGSGKGDAYDGDLSLTIGPTGAIDDASLTLTDGKTLNAVGQATGRAMNLRVDAGGGKTLSFVGTGQQDLILCRGAVDGTFGGPSANDLGAWRATKKNSASNAVATTAPVNGGGTTGGSSAGSGSGSGSSGGGGSTTTDNPTATPTDTPTPSPTATTVPAVPCAKTGESCTSAACCLGYCDESNLCDCVPDGAECAHTGTGACCSGAVCNADGYCGTCAVVGDACSTDNDCCYGQIVALCCFDGTRLAYACTDVGSAGACPGAAPATNCPGGQTACGSICADLSSDARNCGACGASCGLGAICSGGACGAPPPPPAACLDDGADCNLDTDCCGGYCIVGVLGVHDYCSH